MYSNNKFLWILALSLSVSTYLQTALASPIPTPVGLPHGVGANQVSSNLSRVRRPHARSFVFARSHSNSNISKRSPQGDSGHEHDSTSGATGTTGTTNTPATASQLPPIMPVPVLVASNPNEPENSSSSSAPFAVMYPVLAMGGTEASTNGDAGQGTPIVANVNTNVDNDKEANSGGSTSSSNVDLGPGLAVPPPPPTPAGVNGSDTALPVTAGPQVPHKKRPQPYAHPVQKLIIVVGIVAGVGFTAILLMVLAESSHLKRTRALKNGDKGEEDEGDGNGSFGTPEKEGAVGLGLGGIAPLLKFPPPSAAGVLANRTASNKMGNIIRGGMKHGSGGGGLPRSKFSVTSSEYPYSCHSSTYRSTSGTTSSPASSSDSEESIGSSGPSQIRQHQHQHMQVPGQSGGGPPPVTPPVFVVEDCVSPAQLLSPAEFFTMAPSRESTQGQPMANTQGGRLRALPGSSLSTISEEMSRSRSTLSSGPSYSNGRLGGN